LTSSVERSSATTPIFVLSPSRQAVEHRAFSVSKALSMSSGPRLRFFAVAASE
jgi:hypothetical protein